MFYLNLGHVFRGEVFCIVGVYLDAYREDRDREQAVEVEFTEELILALRHIVDPNSRDNI